MCTWDYPFQTMVLANKVFDYMATACRVAAAAHGEVVTLIRKADCGWFVEPERPVIAKLIKTVSRLDKEGIRRKGLNGRNFALKNSGQTTPTEWRTPSFQHVFGR